MKFRWPAALLVVLAFAPASFAASPAPRAGISLSDLITLHRTGIETSVIRERVSTLGLDFDPGPAERMLLREAGFDAAFLEWLAGTRSPAPADSTGPDPRRETVRIFEEINPAGRRILVLTNLDEAGEPIPDPFAIEVVSGAGFRPEDHEVPSPERAGLPPDREPEAPAAPPPPPPVVVEVNVQTPPIYPAFVPYLVAGSPGGIYPTHLDFLGYGNDISKPGWFSGLGLNAANNFGHNTVAKPNNTGLDAFFGPPRP